MKPAPPPTRWKAICAYDGGKFHGWQSQANAVAVQDVIEEALARVLKTSIRVHGSGRTDAGVHAHAQVFHFDAVWRLEPRRLLAALGTCLPPGVLIRSIVPVRSDFHARFDATGKRYHYRIFLGQADPFEAPFCWSLPRGLDLEVLAKAARILRGKHDFAGFSATNGDERETTVRDLRRIEIKRRGRRVRVVLEADGFLYKMARSLVGGMVVAACGQLTLDQLRRVLLSRERIPAVATAPAHGLFLERVFYA